MFITQKVAEFAIYGNAFNSFRVALRFPGGVPAGITAKAYRGDEATEQTALRPTITATARFDTVILEVSAAQMAQVALIDFLYVEIAWGGLVRFRGPFRADRLPAEGKPDEIVIMRNAMGNAMYVFAEELLAQMLDIQSDVNQKLAQIETLHGETLSARDEAVNAVGNILTLVSFDDVSAKVGIGGNVQVSDHSNAPIPYVTVTFL